MTFAASPLDVLKPITVLGDGTNVAGARFVNKSFEFIRKTVTDICDLAGIGYDIDNKQKYSDKLVAANDFDSATKLSNLLHTNIDADMYRRIQQIPELCNVGGGGALGTLAAPGFHNKTYT